MKELENRKNELITLYKKGQSIYNISKQLKISKSTLSRRLKEWGFTNDIQSNCKTNYNDLLKDKLDQVTILFNKDVNIQNIAKEIGHHPSSVKRLLNKHGYCTKAKKYFVDEQFFKTIDIQEKAYILGWIYSDGNVSKKGHIRISLHNKDKEILYKIKDILKYEGDLKDVDKRNQTLLCIGRKCITDDLLKLGCFPNKSLTLKFPTRKQVPDYLIHHFVRGYFDGDGHINVKETGKIWRISITGSYDFINELSKILEIHHVIYKCNKRVGNRKCAHTIAFNKQSDCIKFINYIYKDSNISLKRKFNLALPFIENNNVIK